MCYSGLKIPTHTGIDPGSLCWAPYALITTPLSLLHESNKNRNKYFKVIYLRHDRKHVSGLSSRIYWRYDRKQVSGLNSTTEQQPSLQAIF